MPNEIFQQLSQWFGNLSVFDQVFLPLLGVPVVGVAVKFSHEIHKACTNGIPHIQAAQEEHLKVAQQSRDDAREFYSWMKGSEAGKASLLVTADSRREKETDRVSDKLEG